MGKLILKRTVNMKDHLVIFDFDSTIKKHSPGFTMGVAHLFPGKEIPHELLSILYDNPNRREGWEKCLAAVMQELNKLNLSKEDIVEAYANDGSLIEEMDKVVKTFLKDHDVIIVSDGTRPSIEEFMKKYNLHPYLTRTTTTTATTTTATTTATTTTITTTTTTTKQPQPQ